MKPWLEVGVVLLISALASFGAALVFLLTLQLASGQTSLASFPTNMLAEFILMALAGIVPTSLIWYVKRRNHPYRYLEGALWGVLGYILSASVFLVLSSPTVFRYSASPLGAFGSMMILGFVLSIPVLLTVAPLTVYTWHRTVQRFKARIAVPGA